MGELSKLTGSTSYFEDFQVGLVIRHARGKTMTPLENVLITNLVMNTAHYGYNQRDEQVDRRVLVKRKSHWAQR
jgi:itaconyl-CoA hydratase